MKKDLPRTITTVRCVFVVVLDKMTVHFHIIAYHEAGNCNAADIINKNYAENGFPLAAFALYEIFSGLINEIKIIPDEKFLKKKLPGTICRPPLMS